LERLQNPNQGHKDILQHVVEARRGRTDMNNVVTEVISDLSLFLVAGFETTAHTVVRSLFC
jgi:cytochrome P450